MSKLKLATLLFLAPMACIDTTPTNPSAVGDDPAQDDPMMRMEEMEMPPVFECEPLDNAGCVDQQSCVWEPKDNSAVCRSLEINLQIEEPCNPGSFECGDGLTCAALPKDDGASCYRVCDPEQEDACAGLPGSSPNYMCMGLRGYDYGVCVGAGIQCDPNQDPCGDDEACSIRAGEAVCIPSGSTGVGGDCSYELCEKGLVCANLADRPWPTCLAPCDVAIGTCAESGDVCTGLEGFNFGVCQASMASCNPLVDDCGSDRTCSIDGTDVRCVTTGPTAIGGDCTNDPCAEGGVCVKIVDRTPTCMEPCDLTFPECSTAGFECSSIGLGFGVCL